MKAINLADRLSTFADYWQPRVVGQFNGHDLMVVKVKGEFVWHKHDDTDDFFLVLSGRIDIQLRGEAVSVGPGEIFVVPRGVEHRECRDGGRAQGYLGAFRATAAFPATAACRRRTYTTLAAANRTANTEVHMITKRTTSSVPLRPYSFAAVK